MSNAGTTGIFVATMTGTAELCADEIQDAFDDLGISYERHAMDGLEADALAGIDNIIIVSSTYGHGDIPDNGQALYFSLEDGADLSGKRYAVFGLGDRTYKDTFCRASELWDEVLRKCGATPLTELCQHDAATGSMPEDEACEWAKGWASILS